MQSNYCPPQHTTPVNYSPVEIVEEGEDEKGQLAPGLLQAELERVSVHHGCWVVEQLLRVRWGVEVPTTGRKHHTTGSSPIPNPALGREGGRHGMGQTMGGNGKESRMDKDVMMSDGNWDFFCFLKSQFQLHWGLLML